jgi:hypothetical protein
VTAFLGAGTTRLGAALAVLFRVFSAFLGAGVAYIGTNAADFPHEVRAATHERDAQATNLGAIKAHPRAIGHAAQTFIGAMIAFLSTAATGGDARGMLLM